MCPEGLGHTSRGCGPTSLYPPKQPGPRGVSGLSLHGWMGSAAPITVAAARTPGPTPGQGTRLPGQSYSSTAMGLVSRPPGMTSFSGRQKPRGTEQTWAEWCPRRGLFLPVPVTVVSPLHSSPAHTQLQLTSPQEQVPGTMPRAGGGPIGRQCPGATRHMPPANPPGLIRPPAHSEFSAWAVRKHSGEGPQDPPGVFLPLILIKTTSYCFFKPPIFLK